MGNFEDFISSCLFIHDDTDSSAGVDWDQHGTNTFLLGAKSCVVDSLDGFGEDYIEFLKRIDCFPENIFIPYHKTDDLISNLLLDENVNSKLLSLYRKLGFDISVFYSEEAKLKVLSLFKQEKISPVIHPINDAFVLGNNKIFMRSIIEKNNIPIPPGSICYSLEDILYFYFHVYRSFPDILIKKHHWDTKVISSENEIRSLTDLEYPVIAEVKYPHKASPVSHNLVWKEGFEHQFIVLQDIKNFRHAGNIIPTHLSDEKNDEIIEYSQIIASLIPGFLGVFGIDFIITLDDKIMVVDINPRFNSSTYPFYFMLRMGINLKGCYAKYGFKNCSIKNLSSLFKYKHLPFFNRETKEGILLYSPAYFRKTNRVEKLSFLIVATCPEQIYRLELMLCEAIDQENY